VGSRGKRRIGSTNTRQRVGSPHADDGPVEQVEVLAYRADLALVLHDPDTAAELAATLR
jgi:hypothetical protein